MAQQKYSIVEKVDAGGMAEVWKGKATSLRGFEKLVAIKRVLPNLARNKKFIAMFLDEARLSLYLNHANVVQTFDIGMSENSYFIVMEYVDGSNLKTILDISNARGFSIPQEQAAFIGGEICKGLSHAHNRKDGQQRPLNIVHRDISPPNVLLSKEGEVKLVDFGLAKAASQLTLTDPGVVKGKFSYLCPEAAFGEKVDHRADIFATGIVLWEMLAGRRLFDGKNDLETVELVRRAEIPPLKPFNPNIHPQLESVVRRALAVDPRDRPESTAELAHDLARFLFDNQLMVTSYDIAVLVKRVLADKEREQDVGLRPVTSQAQAIEQLIRDEMNAFTSLEDLERMPFRAMSELDPDASQAGAGGHGYSTEDPRDWAAEMGFDGGDDPGASDEATAVELTPFEKQALGFRKDKTLEELLEGKDAPPDGSDSRPIPLTNPKRSRKGPPPLPPPLPRRPTGGANDDETTQPAGPRTRQDKPSVQVTRTPMPATRTGGSVGEGTPAPQIQSAALPDSGSKLKNTLRGLFGLGRGDPGAKGP